LNYHRASLSTIEHVRLDSYIVDIAAEARGTPICDDSGNYRFGSARGALCVYANGQFHDFSGGAHEHGRDALGLIDHLYPTQDAVIWARAWLTSHPGHGDFKSNESADAADDFAETAGLAYIKTLYEFAGLLEPPGRTYIEQTRKLRLRPEDAATLRWIPEFRGDEGALIAPMTDDAGERVRLMVTHITVDGRKSEHEPCRITIRGAKRPGLLRFGTPGAKVVETEGLEKALAARAAGADYVVVSGGVGNLGKAPLPTIVSDVVIARDDDPPGSPADLSLWRGVVRRLSQGLKVGVTARPKEIAPKDAPPLKDIDDLYRYDPDLVRILLNGANLEHGRLGAEVDNAILDTLSRLDPVAVSRARRSIAALLGIHLGALDDRLAQMVKERIEKREGAASPAKGVEPWPDPVTNIGEALDEAVEAMKKHVVAPDTHFDTVALWALHTHLIHREELDIDITPRLGFQSPEADSGKSTFMKLVRELVPRPKGVGSISSASLFRAVEARKCTLLVDEADYAFHADASPDLKAIFNSGNERTFATVGRAVPLGDGAIRGLRLRHLRRDVLHLDRQAPRQLDAEPLHLAAYEAGDPRGGARLEALPRQQGPEAQGLHAQVHALGGGPAHAARGRGS
jgi:hypothetical protein